MEAVNWIVENWELILAAILQFIGAVSIIAKLTPTPKDDAILARVVGVINMLALNTSKKEDTGK